MDNKLMSFPKDKKWTKYNVTDYMKYEHDLCGFDNKKAEQLMPSKTLQGKAGIGDFLTVGKHFTSWLKRFGLERDSRLLDIGCGVGRLAIPLTQYVDKYDGLDVDLDSIYSCRERIKSKFLDFRFQYIDVKNEMYNKDGDRDPSTVWLPYQNSEFDFVAAISLFTHMESDGIDNYLKESARILKDGGILFATFFLGEGYANGRKDSICISTDRLSEGLSGAELKLEKCFYGMWNNKRSRNSYQDIVIARK